MLYLDIEVGGPLSAKARAYLRAWVDAVRAGGYVAGSYMSSTAVPSALQLVPGLVAWIFKLKTADQGVYKAAPFREDLAASNVAAAHAWQWAQNCTIDGPGAKVLVDLNVAASADPSLAVGSDPSSIEPVPPVDVPPPPPPSGPPVQPAPLPIASPWLPSPPPAAGGPMVVEIDPRVPSVHIPGKPCPGNPGPPIGWKYWSGSLPAGGQELAIQMRDDTHRFPMGAFVQARLGDQVVGARVEWHTIQGTRGNKGCFRGVNLMRAESWNG